MRSVLTNEMIMTEPSLQTHPSLLIRLRDDRDDEAWSRFAETYIPIVHGFVSRQGLQDSDAVEITQDVMMAVSSGIRKFEHRAEIEGSFRRWLFTIVRNRLRDFWRKERRQVRGTGDTIANQILNQLPAAADELSEQWNEEYQRRLFHTAARQVKGDFSDSTWNAFWRTTVNGESPQDVAVSLEISVPAVYMSKRRIVKRIQEYISFLEGETA